MRCAVGICLCNCHFIHVRQHLCLGICLDENDDIVHHLLKAQIDGYPLDFAFILVFSKWSVGSRKKKADDEITKISYMIFSTVFFFLVYNIKVFFSFTHCDITEHNFFFPVNIPLSIFVGCPFLFSFFRLPVFVIVLSFYSLIVIVSHLNVIYFLMEAYMQIHRPKDLNQAESARRRLIFDEFFYLQVSFLCNLWLKLIMILEFNLI